MVMHEWDTLKVYGRILRSWTTTDSIGMEYPIQFEVSYNEYDATGKLVNKGTEDFSARRWADTTTVYGIWCWDGKKRNNGGNRHFRLAWHARVSTGNKYKLAHIAKLRYPEAATIDIRKY